MLLSVVLCSASVHNHFNFHSHSTQLSTKQAKSQFPFLEKRGTLLCVVSFVCVIKTRLKFNSELNWALSLSPVVSDLQPCFFLKHVSSYQSYVYPYNKNSNHILCKKTRFLFFGAVVVVLYLHTMFNSNNSIKLVYWFGFIL